MSNKQFLKAKNDMKVLIVAGGIPKEGNLLSGIFEYDQAKALSKQGIEIGYAVVDLRSIRRKRPFGISEYQRDGIQVFVISLPLGAVPAGLFDVVGSTALKSLYRRIESSFGKPDIIHAHFLEMAAITHPLSKTSGIPLVITEHSSKLNNKAYMEKHLMRAKKAYGNAGAVIAVSSSLRERIKEYTGIESIVIPNIIDSNGDTYAPVRKDDVFRFISAGSLIFGKGFDILIQSFFRIIQRGIKNCELIIMGGGPEEESLKDLVKTENLTDKVEFRGKYVREDFFREMRECNAFVLSSRSETFGVVYAEALSCGLPVIATKCGGPEDFINQSNGILVEVDDIDGLADAMIDMISKVNKNYFNSKQISESSRLEYSGDRIAKRIVDVYKEVVNI